VIFVKSKENPKVSPENESHVAAIQSAKRVAAALLGCTVDDFLPLDKWQAPISFGTTNVDGARNTRLCDNGKSLDAQYELSINGRARVAICFESVRERDGLRVTCEQVDLHPMPDPDAAKKLKDILATKA